MFCSWKARLITQILTDSIALKSSVKPHYDQFIPFMLKPLSSDLLAQRRKRGYVTVDRYQSYPVPRCPPFLEVPANVSHPRSSSKISKAVLFRYSYMNRAGAPFVQDGPGLYTSLVFDTDLLKMALRDRNVSGAFDKRAPGDRIGQDHWAGDEKSMSWKGSFLGDVSLYRWNNGAAAAGSAILTVIQFGTAMILKLDMMFSCWNIQPVWDPLGSTDNRFQTGPIIGHDSGSAQDIEGLEEINSCQWG